MTTDPHAASIRGWTPDYLCFDICEYGAIAISALGDIQIWGQQIPNLGSVKVPTAPFGGIRLTASGRGYWIWLTDGSIHSFGDAVEMYPWDIQGGR